MGVVYRARDTQLHRDVALKVLPDHFANDPERLDFQREAQHRSAVRNFQTPVGGHNRPTVTKLVRKMQRSQRGKTYLPAGQVSSETETSQPGKSVMD